VGQNIYSMGLKSKESGIFVVFLLICLVGFSFTQGHSRETPLFRLQSAGDRAQTLQALQAINQGRWPLAEHKIAQTKDPLAAKLYYWLVFTKGSKSNWGNTKFVRLAHFIRQNPEWPGIRDMRLLAEDVIPDNLPASDVVAWFGDYRPLTTSAMDRYLSALISSGRRDRAKEYLADWWASTLSMSRDEQRQIYRKYGGLLDREDHRKRMDALLFAGHNDSARGVAKVLGNGYTQLAEARIALAAQKKNGVSALINRVPRVLQSDPGLLYERLRWRRRNNLDVGAMEILHNAPPVEYIQNPAAWWQERHIIIRRLLEKGHHESAYLLASQHMQKRGFSYAQAEWLAGWLALRFMNKPEEALQRFESLYSKVKTPISKSRASYWAGRAAKDLGQMEASAAWYQKAAVSRTTYYGQLAAAELSLENKLPSAAPPVLTQSDKRNFAKGELVQAAQLFHDAGMRKEASSFIQSFVKYENTPKAYRYGAELAADMEQYHDAIRIAKNATKQGMFLTAQSYPVIAKRLAKVDLEWALVHALIRQESMFDYQAKSPAGALGLMQLMPATAREVARKKGISHQTGWLTNNPDYNIALGTAYLDQMLERFNGSYVMAIAAYNAGPSRVLKWVDSFGDPRSADVDMVDWIEMLSIYETRNYVQRVMEGIYVYRLRLKGVQKKPDQSLYIAMIQGL